MILLFLIIILQLVIAVIVFFVLKGLLDRELKKVAIEKFLSLKVISGIDSIYVYYAGDLALKFKEELTVLAKSKFTDSKNIFEQNQILKGGLVIVVAQEVLVFSVSSRLENFWS